MTEAQFSRKVQKWIEASGGWVVKFYSNQYTRKGIPDLLICLNGAFIAIELKLEYNKTTKHQDHEIQLIRKSGGKAFVLTPSTFNELKHEVDLGKLFL